MLCERCRREIDQPEPEWMMDLRYLSKQREPIFGGPLQRGEADGPYTKSLELLVRRGYIEQVELKGFVITDKGRDVLRGVSDGK